MAESTPYPVVLNAVYPERLTRWKTLLRIFLIIPVLVFWAAVSGTANGVVVASWLAILVRGRIPHWLFDFQVALYRWESRALGYVLLLVESYPSFEGDWLINYDVRYPERLARWKLLFWKFITAIPHFIILAFLILAAIVVTIICWFFILFTGRYPRGLHGFVVGVMRWGARVQAYVVSLTDEYPPFALSAEAGPAGGDAYLISSVLGFLLAGGTIAGIVVAAVLLGETLTVDVGYQSLQQGAPANTVGIGDVRVTLTLATDPLSADKETVLQASPGRRLVLFQFSVANEGGGDVRIRESDFELKDARGKEHDPELVTVEGEAAPQDVEDHETDTVKVVFEVAEGVAPTELKYAPSFGFRKSIEYEFR